MKSIATTFHVSVPDSMEAFLKQRVEEKSFRSRGSYVQELIRQDQIRTEKVKLTNMLLVGLASKRKKMTKKKWDAMRDDAVKSIRDSKK